MKGRHSGETTKRNDHVRMAVLFLRKEALDGGGEGGAGVRAPHSAGGFASSLGGAYTDVRLLSICMLMFCPLFGMCVVISR